MNITLSQLDDGLKRILISFLIALTMGVITGLVYLNYTTNYSSSGAIERFKGNESETLSEEFDIPETYAKNISEMLITTHNHVIGFSLIFLPLTIIFFFNSVITGVLKNILIVEPFFSTVISFGSLWLVRFVSSDFIYLTIISAVLIYSSYFIMAGVSLYELIFTKSGKQNNKSNSLD
ncbi:MAG TPA: hypothetical protein VF270_12100 [Ignavibacteriaceae bacterium]